ncbi:MAG TPA: glycosyltransferase family 10, partial [Thermodesulfobacteriota bacterium]|nr:glycosyltransferase family 10 [Thermodesulfobacteriota bacterium]
MHRGLPSYHRIYTPDVEDLRGKRYIHRQPALPWLVNKDYDYLIDCGVPTKERCLSWITSNLRWLPVHRARMHFLESISEQIEFDLFGKGFVYIEDKWDGLAPYQYSFAIENYRNPYYWSEKIADCLLAWTMPIYYGCTRIIEYFPSE